MKQTSHSGKLYGFDNQSNLLTDYESRLLESYSQMNFIFLRMADNKPEYGSALRKRHLDLGPPLEGEAENSSKGPGLALYCGRTQRSSVRH